ncbi:MAG: hypothetical protein ABR499_06275 [Gemmatimonadaceae bacterium]
MQRRCWSPMLVGGRTRCIARRAVARDLLALLALFASTACGGGDATVRDTTANSVPGEGTVATVGAPTDTAAPQGATWNLEMVEGQLREAGFTVSRDRTPVNLPFMSVPGTALDLGAGVTVQVYLYGDAAARGLDTDKLDTNRAAPRTGAAPWRTPAVLVTDNNLAAIVLAGDQPIRSRIRDALHRRADGDGALR